MKKSAYGNLKKKYHIDVEASTLHYEYFVFVFLSIPHKTILSYGWMADIVSAYIMKLKILIAKLMCLSQDTHHITI